MIALIVLSSTRADAQSSRLKAGTLVRPDTVSVGDPFAFVVSVQVPGDARVEWPTITDSSAVVVMREPTRVRSSIKDGERVETATYELAAWDVGILPLKVPDAIVRYADKVERVPLSAARIVVKSVLPGDTTLHTPKPAKALFPRVLPWWQRWWPAIAVLVALLLLWWLYKRRRHSTTARVRDAMDPYQRAVHDFERIERLALVPAGERGRYVALAMEILRTYLSARIPEASLSRTTQELAVIVADDPRIPLDVLVGLSAEVDGIKYARLDVSAQRARDLAGDARTVVDRIERAEQARLAEIEAARLAKARAERAAAAALEDEARRRSRRAKSGAA